MAVGDVVGGIETTSFAIQPSVGVTYKVTHISSTIWGGDTSSIERPHVDVGLAYGLAGPVSYARYYPGSADGPLVWRRPLDLYCTNSTPVAVEFSSGQVVWRGVVVSEDAGAVGTGKSSVHSSDLAAGSYLTVQPSGSEHWLVTEALTDAWYDGGGGPVGVVPNVEVYLYNGMTEVKMRSPGNPHYANLFEAARPLRLGINNSIYMRLKNSDSSSSARIGYSAIRIV